MPGIGIQTDLQTYILLLNNLIAQEAKNENKRFNNRRFKKH